MIPIDTLIKEAAKHGDGLRLTSIEVQCYAAEIEARDAVLGEIAASIRSFDDDFGAAGECGL